MRLLCNKRDLVRLSGTSGRLSSRQNMSGGSLQIPLNDRPAGTSYRVSTGDWIDHPRNYTEPPSYGILNPRGFFALAAYRGLTAAEAGGTIPEELRGFPRNFGSLGDGSSNTIALAEAYRACTFFGKLRNFL